MTRKPKLGMPQQILCSSDHHANWDALEYWFNHAQEHNLPFLINGDVVGDYNFEEIAQEFGYTILSEYDATHPHISKLQNLFFAIVEFHAHKLAQFIDKYAVQTYYLLGNHEPANFCDIVKKYLKNKELFVDMSQSGLLNINGFTIAGISNTSHMCSYLHSIFSQEQLDSLFTHMRTHRPVISQFDKTTLLAHPNPYADFDWVRIVGDSNNHSATSHFDNSFELDIFVTHGQIGQGAWSNEKFASEMPTLLSAAKLSAKSKVTIDAHLHTTHAMKNCLGIPTLRAVGNRAILLEKDDSGQITYEILDNEHEYKAKKGVVFTKKDLVWFLV
jgi:hypothetical protein